MSTMNLEGRRIIVNNDFDGCLSSKIMTTLYNGKVVGFSNSKDKLWFVDGETFNGDELFIDMFTPYYESIDQHIPPMDFEKSWSPNKERGIYAFGAYTSKFPFSTSLWLLAIAARDNKDISLVLPKTLTLGNNGIFRECDIWMRSDDILNNCYKYTKNCEAWRDWLIEFSGNHKDIIELFNFMFSQDRSAVETWKFSTDEYFRLRYGFSNEEIPDITTEQAKRFMGRFGIHFEKITEVITLENVRVNIATEEDFNNVLHINENKLFSFAFIYSPARRDKNNFSYSIFL